MQNSTITLQKQIEIATHEMMHHKNVITIREKCHSNLNQQVEHEDYTLFCKVYVEDANKLAAWIWDHQDQLHYTEEQLSNYYYMYHIIVTLIEKSGAIINFDDAGIHQYGYKPLY